MLYIKNFKKVFGMNGLLPVIALDDPEKWCVKKCPEKFVDFTAAKDAEENKDQLICFPGVKDRIFEGDDPTQHLERMREAINKTECASVVYPSHEGKSPNLLRSTSEIRSHRCRKWSECLGSRLSREVSGLPRDFSLSMSSSIICPVPQDMRIWLTPRRPQSFLSLAVRI